jgi:glycosyltransferase involved in cell wall biosynthesis
VAAGYPGAARHETIDGIKVERLRGIHSLWLTTFLRYVARHRGRYDVVVAEGFGGSRIPRLAPLYVREPIITEWHQVHRDLFAAQYPPLLNGPLNLLERATARVHRDTLVRAGTDDWRDAFPSIGFRADNVFVVPVSIRDEWLAQQNGSPSQEPVILWLGKLRRYKSPHHAIEALPAVREAVPDARLVIAGRRDDLAYQGELEAMVSRLGLGSAVKFRPDLTEREKRDLIHESRVMAVTSAVEGFGIVVLEANASGLPVVASSGVPKGAVRDDFNGRRYPYGDIAALADRLIQLLTDGALYARLSKNALEYSKRFSWSRVGAEFEEVVQRAAAARR